MSKVLVTDTYLSNIADSIRAKLGVSTTYKPSQMAGAIDSIETGATNMATGRIWVNSNVSNGLYKITSSTTLGFVPSFFFFIKENPTTVGHTIDYSDYMHFSTYLRSYRYKPASPSDQYSWSSGSKMGTDWTGNATAPCLHYDSMQTKNISICTSSNFILQGSKYYKWIAIA